MELQKPLRREYFDKFSLVNQYDLRDSLKSYERIVFPFRGLYFVGKRQNTKNIEISLQLKDMYNFTIIVKNSDIEHFFDVQCLANRILENHWHDIIFLMAGYINYDNL